MNRRSFIQLLGLGTAAAAVPTILLPEPEPVRRYWQVPRNAPVGGSTYAHMSRLIDQAVEETRTKLEQALKATQPLLSDHEAVKRIVQVYQRPTVVVATGDEAAKYAGAQGVTVVPSLRQAMAIGGFPWVFLAPGHHEP